MKNLFLLLVVACCSLESVGQINLDSLYTVWQDETQADSNRANAYNNYIWYGFLHSNSDTAFVLAQDLLSFGEEKPYEKAKAMACNLMGASSWLKSDYPKALENYQRSLSIYEEIGDKKGSTNTVNNIGIIYLGQKDYTKALDYFQRSLKISEENGDKKSIANAINNIGIIYNKQGNHTKALEYYQRSLKIYEETGDKKGSATAINNIGSIYKGQGDYLKAMDCFQRSLKIAEEIGSKNGSINAIGNIGHIYLKEGDHLKALEFCKKALAISQEIGALNEEESACHCLYDTYKAMGKGNEALVYLEKMNVLNDSLNAEETAKKLQQMEFAKTMLQDSIAKAEETRLVEEAHQEEVRQKNRTRNIFGGVGFFALLLAGGFFWRWRYVQQSKATLQVEKDRSENLLLNILPADIAAELKEKGKADARDFDMVSILFTDFKGFTAASEKLSAQELVAEINTCFEAFDGIMGKYNIEKIKTIGDAYMAAGGLPVPSDDAVKNTVLAALEMQAFITDRKATNDAANKPAFEMRVGIHTGPVVAGIVGVKKFAYDIWGDTVNTASRMESSGGVGKVNISQATYELLKDDADFTFESRGKIEAKGKGKVKMYFVEALG